jgi:putative addiction module antidote
MSTQQIRKVGNSYVVTVPREEMERLKLAEGDTVAVQVNKVRTQIQLPEDVQGSLDRVLERHGGAID